MYARERACMPVHAFEFARARVRRECVGSCLPALLNEVSGKKLTPQTT